MIKQSGKVLRLNLFKVGLLTIALTVPVGCSGIHSAARGGDIAGVKKFLDEGVDVNGWEGHNARLGIYENTPLMAAAVTGHVEVAKLLLSRGADVNAVSRPSGITALLGASNKGHLEMVEFLISRGAIVNVEDRDGCTPWLTAVLGKHVDVAKLLGSKGAMVPHAVLKIDPDIALTGQVAQVRSCNRLILSLYDTFMYVGSGAHDVKATYRSVSHIPGIGLYGPYATSRTTRTEGFPISLALNLDKGYIYEMKPVFTGNSRWTVSINPILRFTE